MLYRKSEWPLWLRIGLHPHFYNVMSNDDNYPPNRTVIEIDSNGGIQVSVEHLEPVHEQGDPEEYMDCPTCSRRFKRKSFWAHKKTMYHRSFL